MSSSSLMGWEASLLLYDLQWIRLVWVYALQDLWNVMRVKLDVEVSDQPTDRDRPTDHSSKLADFQRFYAACQGRVKVDPKNCLMPQHVSWKLPEQHVLMFGDGFVGSTHTRSLMKQEQ